MRLVTIHAQGRVTHPRRQLSVSIALGLLAACIAFACGPTQQVAPA